MKDSGIFGINDTYNTHIWHYSIASTFIKMAGLYLLYLCWWTYQSAKFKCVW